MPCSSARSVGPLNELGSIDRHGDPVGRARDRAIHRAHHLGDVAAASSPPLARRRRTASTRPRCRSAPGTKNGFVVAWLTKTKRQRGCGSRKDDGATRRRARPRLSSSRRFTRVAAAEQEHGGGDRSGGERDEDRRLDHLERPEAVGRLERDEAPPAERCEVLVRVDPGVLRVHDGEILACARDARGRRCRRACRRAPSRAHARSARCRSRCGAAARGKCGRSSFSTPSRVATNAAAATRDRGERCAGGRARRARRPRARRARRPARRGPRRRTRPASSGPRRRRTAGATRPRSTPISAAIATSAAPRAARASRAASGAGDRPCVHASRNVPCSNSRASSGAPTSSASAGSRISQRPTCASERELAAEVVDEQVAAGPRGGRQARRERLPVVRVTDRKRADDRGDRDRQEHRAGGQQLCAVLAPRHPCHRSLHGALRLRGVGSSPAPCTRAADPRGRSRRPSTSGSTIGPFVRTSSVSCRPLCRARTISSTPRIRPSGRRAPVRRRCRASSSSTGLRA